MEIKILGSGCANCKKLEENARKAVSNLGIETEISKVQDFKDIAKYGVMKTPALVVDGEVKIVGKVASTDEIEKLLK